MRIAACAVSAAIVGVSASSCSLGEGSGQITGTLDIPNCWSGTFDLKPDFFAGVPSRNSLQLRIQNGGDYETFSDGVSILIDDVHIIRGDNGQPGYLGQPLAVSLPPSVVPPGVPITPNPNPAMVHMSLYLTRTCHIQDPALYALDQVALTGNGQCGGGAPPTQCAGGGPSGGGGTDGGAPAVDGGGAEAGANPVSTGRSTITFTHLFDANPDETDAAQRLSEGSFNVYLADPREICPGGLGPPPPCRGQLSGRFSFYFQRGKPAQPFP
jgi:hypothetical protein